MKSVTLGELANFKHGSTPSKSEPQYWGGSVPWASSRDIKIDTLDDTSIHVTDEAVREAKLPIAPVGSLLIVVRSGILAHTVPVAEVRRAMAFNQDIVAIVPDATRIDLGWLRLLVKSRSEEILTEGIKVGATVPSFQSGYLKALRVPLMPLHEQRARAEAVCRQLALFSGATAGIQEQRDHSELLLRSILSSEFQDGCPIAVRGAAHRNASWSWNRLLDLARLYSGHTPSRRRPEWWGGKIPWLALPDIRKLHGRVAQQTVENTNDLGLANSSARLLPVGTVCLCRDASIGFVTMLGRPMATSQHFCNWVCDRDRLDPEFLMYAFMASHEYLRELGSGSVLKTIYMPAIESFHICAPDIAEQRRIARRLRERLAEAEALSTGLKARLAEIEQLPQRILAAAFGPRSP